MIRIGWASRDFTPERPALIQGQMHVRIGRQARDPLTLTAMAVDGGAPQSRVILISADLPMISEKLLEMVRRGVSAREKDVPPEAIIMNATHTHDALITEDGFYPHPGGDIMTGSEGCRLVAEKAVEAAIEAWKNRSQALIGRAFGHAVVGHNRRAVYRDGSARMYGATDDPAFSHIEGYEDHSMDMIFVWGEGGELRGVAIDIPCPSQVEECLTEFSADFWHDIRVDLRHRFGSNLHVLPLCGAAGDQSPHLLVYGKQESEMRARRGLTERQEIALRVGAAVERSLACTHPDPMAAQVAHRWRKPALPPRAITREERDWAEAEYRKAIERGDDPRLWWPVMLMDVVRRFDEGRTMPSYEAEIHAVRLGDAVLVTNPFELFLDYGLQIKARSRAAQTIVVQLACGRGMYLPTERAVKGGHYGAHPVVAPVGPEGGRCLVEESLELIDETMEVSSSRTSVPGSAGACSKRR